MGRLGITKRFLFMAIAAGMGLVCGFGAQSQEAREKPNILLFMADDTTWAATETRMFERRISIDWPMRAIATRIVSIRLRCARRRE